MPHLGAFVPSNYFAFIYVPVYSYKTIGGTEFQSFLEMFGANLRLRSKQTSTWLGN